MYNPVTHDKFKKEISKSKSIQNEISKIEDEYLVYKELLSARNKAGLSQTEVAKRMKTTPSVISRLESVGNKRSPSINTLKKYAEAIGCKLSIQLTQTA